MLVNWLDWATIAAEDCTSTFCLAASVRCSLDRSLYATAMPPASSAGLTIRLPDDKRARLFRRASFVLERLNEAVVAVTILLTTIGMDLV